MSIALILHRIPISLSQSHHHTISSIHTPQRSGVPHDSHTNREGSLPCTIPMLRYSLRQRTEPAHVGPPVVMRHTPKSILLVSTLNRCQETQQTSTVHCMKIAYIARWYHHLLSLSKTRHAGTPPTCTPTPSRNARVRRRNKQQPASMSNLPSQSPRPIASHQALFNTYRVRIAIPVY
jgi:hypothetical protein